MGGEAAQQHMAIVVVHFTIIYFCTVKWGLHSEKGIKSET